VGIRKLGYIGLNTADITAWTRLLEDTLGVSSTTEEAGSGEVTLAGLDEFQYRLALYPAREEAVRHIGWIVDSASELARLTDRLAEAGFEVHEACAQEAALRGATDLRWFTDPVGYRVELAVGEAKARTRPARPADATPGVTGLGHFVLASPNVPELRELYETVLEFRLTDYRAPGLFFYRCNRTHHSIALAPASSPSIHHLEIDHGSIDDVGRAFDRAEANGVPVSIGLGRHMNDKTISFYVKNPSGFHLEIGFGGIEVDDDWLPHDFTVPSVWGHKHASANPFASPARP
jgi:2,3-dihydroxybiphenyl 1,2-dioxygenase